MRWGELEPKAATEKTLWEQFIRAQVLSLMQQDLKRLEDILFLLKQTAQAPHRPRPGF